MTIEELLQTEGKYVGPTSGVSMLPMLKSGRDSVVIMPKTERLKPWDVALYKRGDDYVLHRVIRQTDDGYIIRGDNCYSDEKIKEERVIGVLTEYFKAEKRVQLDDPKYLRYVKRRIKNYKLRRFFFLIKSKAKNAVKRILIFLRLKRPKV